MTQKYRKKPVVVEALQLTWANWNDMCEFADVGKFSDGKPEGVWVDPETGEHSFDPHPWLTPAQHEIGMLIHTAEGIMLARENDWVIRDMRGLYPCKPNVFEWTYEPAV